MRRGDAEDGWPFLPRASPGGRRLFTKRREGARVRLLLVATIVTAAAVLLWLGGAWL